MYFQEKIDMDKNGINFFLSIICIEQQMNIIQNIPNINKKFYVFKTLICFQLLQKLNKRVYKMLTKISHEALGKYFSTEKLYSNKELVDLLLFGKLQQFISVLQKNGEIISMSQTECRALSKIISEKSDTINFKNKNDLHTLANYVLGQSNKNSQNCKRINKQNTRNIFDNYNIEGPVKIKQKAPSVSQFPILLIDTELSALRFEVFNRMVPNDEIVDERQKKELQSFLLILNCPLSIERVFTSIKELAVQILNNQSNQFLEIYVKFLLDYCQYYKNLGKQYDQKSIQKQKVLRILKQGISQAQIVLCPKSNLYGLTIKDKILINYYRFAYEYKKIVIEQEKDLKLFKGIFLLTLFHQLTHYLIRKMQFSLDNDHSFSLTDKQQRSSQLHSQYKHSSDYFYFPALAKGQKSQIISQKLCKIIVKYCKKINQYLQQIYSGISNIEEVDQQTKKQIFKYLISQIINFEVLEKFLPQLIATQSNTNHSKKQSTFFAQYILKFIQRGKLNKDTEQRSAKLQQYFISLRSQENYLAKLNDCFKKLLEHHQIQFLQTLSSEVNPQDTGIFQKKNINQLENYLSQLYNTANFSQKLKKLKNLGNLRNKVLDKQQNNSLQLMKILSQLFKLQLSDISMLIQINNYQLIEEIQSMQKLLNFKQTFSKLVQKCLQFTEYNSLPSILKHSSLQSGWIIEDSLFQKLHTSNESHVYFDDYDILSQLSSCTDKSKCIQLRSRFGNKQLIHNKNREGPKILAQREGSDEQENSVKVPFDSCLHYWLRYSSKK